MYPLVLKRLYTLFQQKWKDLPKTLYIPKCVQRWASVAQTQKSEDKCAEFRFSFDKFLTVACVIYSKEARSSHFVSMLKPSYWFASRNRDIYFCVFRLITWGLFSLRGSVITRKCRLKVRVNAFSGNTRLLTERGRYYVCKQGRHHCHQQWRVKAINLGAKPCAHWEYNIALECFEGTSGMLHIAHQHNLKRLWTDCVDHF